MHTELSITAKTEEVLICLRTGRTEHVEIVQEAKDGFLKKAEEMVAAKLAEIREGRLTSLLINLTPPADHTDDYDIAIQMLEMHVRAGQDTIELGSQDVSCFIMGRWAWAQSFYAQNALYSGTAIKKGREGGYLR